MDDALLQGRSRLELEIESPVGFKYHDWEMMNEMRIEICGSIASGKTTLAARLAPAVAGRPVLENFRANPFWNRFYKEPQLFRPEKDVCFLAQHTGEIKAAGKGNLVCDYAAIQDIAYAELARDVNHSLMMRAVYQQLYQVLPPPVLIVHLTCEVNELLRRIRRRGRPEEQRIDSAYLKSLEEALSELLGESSLLHSGVKIFPVRSDEVDFANQDAQAGQLCTKIHQIISELTQQAQALN
ncbi:MULTISPECIES: deoxynucleoside kinase [unclassified Methylobacterium]|uniref:deoxynucleoside kinase n=1 Tax=Bacteria TaxID=2 RepID=UPI0036FAF0C3